VADDPCEPAEGRPLNASVTGACAAGFLFSVIFGFGDAGVEATGDSGADGASDSGADGGSADTARASGKAGEPGTSDVFFRTIFGFGDAGFEVAGAPADEAPASRSAEPHRRDASKAAGAIRTLKNRSSLNRHRPHRNQWKRCHVNLRSTLLSANGQGKIRCRRSQQFRGYHSEFLPDSHPTNSTTEARDGPNQ
jgi:hypothetical protein